MFYLFKDGEKVVKDIKEVMPLRVEYKERLFKRVGNVSYAILYGHVVTALIQGVVGTIGLLIIGVKSALLWGLVMMIFALVPFVGTPIVWIPLGLIEFISGNPAKGILVLLYGALVISSIDNIIKPRIIGKKAQVHPVLILLGVLGGIKMFGFVGLMFGPLLLALLLVLLDLYQVDRVVSK